MASFRLLVASALVPSVLALSAVANAGSSASSAVSDSVGSLSTSIRGSSESSSTTKTAQGPYEVMEVTALADQPGSVQLSMRPAGNQMQGIKLVLPLAIAERARVQAGTVVQAEQREYGVAFSVRTVGGVYEPFFLVLDDAVYRELTSRRVSL